MKRASFVTRVLKPALWVAGLAPAVWIVRGLVRDELGADPVRAMQQDTGLTTLIVLLLTLAITPLRRLTRFNELVRVRRLVGLFAFFYATLHAFTYFVFDQQLSVPDIAADVAKHPWVTVGFAGFVLLVPLAVTSTSGWIRRLGGRRWARLHRLIYLVAVLGVLHFLWLVKKDVRPPLTYGAVLVALFALRLGVAYRPRPAAAGRP